MSKHHDKFEVGWYLFKPGGKMAYAGTSKIHSVHGRVPMIWDDEFMRQVVENQENVVTTAFTKSEFVLVTYDLAKYDKDPGYCYCYTGMFQFPEIYSRWFRGREDAKKENHAS